MQTPYLIPLIILGAVGSIQYFFGLKQNRWIGKTLSVQLEETLKPRDTNYVNIGGAIGHNFNFKLRDPWKEAKGSFTLFPRHSLLYMPFSLLLGNSDRFYLNLFTDKRLAGEGHVIDVAHLKHAKIDGIESMERKDVQRGTKTFALLWKGEDLRPSLERSLDAFPDPGTLSHFCCFGDNKTFFLYLKPRKAVIGPNLAAFVKNCPEYFR